LGILFTFIIDLFKWFARKMNYSDIIEQLKLKSNQIPINKKDLERLLDILFNQILFPINDENTRECLSHVYSILYQNISNLLGEKEAASIVDIFINELPVLQRNLLKEAECYVKNDPAAKSIEEIILAYPGFYALVIHRLSHFLHKQNVPLLPRVFSEYVHSKVGIDIHPAAQIGNNFFIDHGTGIVIGETTVIGNNVKVYQGVTIGALFVSKSLKDKKRHPTIEDNVVIYAGATILGGNTVVGHDSTIGGNVWLTKSVLPYSLVYHTAEMRIKQTDLDDVIDFSI
jgi:serine O-acetyltransferase